MKQKSGPDKAPAERVDRVFRWAGGGCGAYGQPPQGFALTFAERAAARHDLLSSRTPAKTLVTHLAWHKP